jgi:hypothetical protein
MTWELDELTMTHRKLLKKQTALELTWFQTTANSTGERLKQEEMCHGSFSESAFF